VGILLPGQFRNVSLLGLHTKSWLVILSQLMGSVLSNAQLGNFTFK
jgi:hypothetical protein